MNISPEDSDHTVNTNGGAYIGENVNTQGGDFVGRDQYVNPTFYITTDQFTSLSAQPSAPPSLFIGRQEEMRQLNLWLEEVTPDFMRNESRPAGKMVLIYGVEGMGKSSLMRRWLADLSKRQKPPIIAHITFDLHGLVGKAYEAVDWIPPIYKLDWQRLTSSLPNQTKQEKTPVDFLPSNFRLGSCPWITLAAQLSLQSQTVRDALNKDSEWQYELKHDSIFPPDALTELLKVATEEGQPIILACEGLQYASKEWFALLKKWELDSRRQKWPLLLLLEYRYPQPLNVSAVVSTADARLQWLRESCGAPYFRASAIQLMPLTRYDIEAFLLPASQQYAIDLHILSDGNPKILSELLAYWRRHEAANEELSGYWQLRWLPTDTYLFMGSEQNNEPLFDSITRSLQRSSELAAELGYDLSPDELLEWLNYAVWEGDTFSDQALARVVGLHGESLNDFLTVLDGALCASKHHPTGLLEELDETIALPYGDKQTHYMARYRFTPTLVAVLLRQRQSPQERQRFGQAYAEALLSAYTPYYAQILEPLANIYQSLGLSEIAASYRESLAMLAYLNQEEADLSRLLVEATTDSNKRLFVKRLLSYYFAVIHRRHPRSLLPWLTVSLDFTRQLGVKDSEASTLHGIGNVYSRLGENQQALDSYNHALPLLRQLGNKVGEAEIFNSIGIVYSDLGEKQQALDYYNQALPLFQQLGNKGGEANALNNIGIVCSDLGEKQQALDYYNQALPLFQQLGNKGGEANALNNIGNVYSSLGEKQQALDYYNQALPLQRQVGHVRHEANLLNNIGVVYSDLGAKQQALDYYNQALPLQRQVGHVRHEANLLNNIGVVYSDLGAKQQALDYYNQALPLRGQVGNKWDERGTRNNLTYVYEELGDLLAAIEQQEQVVAIDEVVQHPSLEKDRAGLARLREKLQQSDQPPNASPTSPTV